MALATPSSSIVVPPERLTVGASLSVIVTVAVCVPFSVAPFPPVTFVISAITVSLFSDRKSEVGSMVTVPVV